MSDASKNEAGFGQSDQRKTAIGTAMSVVGGAILASSRALGFVLRALFGGEAWGLYSIAWSLIELLAFMVLGGFNDAVVIFASRIEEAERGKDERALDKHYAALATVILVPLAVSTVIAAGLSLGAGFVYQAFWSDHDPLLMTLTSRLAWALPLLVLMQIPVEAIRARLSFAWAIGIVQIAFPVLSIALAIGLHYTIEPSILAVVDGALLALLLCIPFSLFGFQRHYDLPRFMKALARVPFDREVLSFAIPQSANMALNQGLVRVDTIMLSFFGIPASTIGVYALVSELTQSIRLSKMAFSGVYSPLVARYRASQNFAGIREALEFFTRKTSSLGIPLLVLIMATWPVWIFKQGEVFEDSIAFPWLLSAGPMMSCFFGLCGNTLLMMGYSRVLLKNALAAGTVNLILNAALIPVWGIFGAALATAISNVFISCLQMIELRKFEAISVQGRFYARTLWAALVPVAGAATLSLLPAASSFHIMALDRPTAVSVALGLLALYGALQWVLPGRRPFGAAPA